MSTARLASKGDGPQGDPVRSIARQIAGRSSAAGCHSSRILQGEITSHLAGETTGLDAHEHKIYLIDGLPCARF
jgi:hypothetical protein